MNTGATSDQGLALVHALADRVSRIDWLVVLPEATPPIAVPSNVRFKKRHSFAGVWAFLRARWIFHTHGIYGNLTPPASQTIVNMWHAMPTKLVGPPAGRPMVRATYALATAPVFQKILADTWSMSDRSVLVTGQPRTDRMLSPQVPHDRQQATDGYPPNTSLWIWLPTYRHSEMGGGHRDGHEANNLFQLPGVRDEDIDQLNERLEQNGCLVLIKPHPMSITRLIPFRDRSNIKRIDESWMTSRDLTLYRLLGATDGLITDMSSVWIDYLLLDRPIIFGIADLAEYQKTRGLYFDDFEAILPGPLTSNLEDVLQEIEQVQSGEDRYGTKRAAARKRFHTFTDDRSSERLLEAIGL